MWRNYLTIAWRNIIKNGVFSAINIFGLAVGLMSCILIMLFVREESGFDRWLKDSDRLVRMHTAYIRPDGPAFLTVRSAGMMMPAVRDYAKNEIEDGVRLIPFGMTVRKGEDAFDETITMADGSFFNIFDLPFVYGDPSSSFTKPLDTIITEKMALKYFGRTDVIGETLTLCCLRDNTVSMTISGVIKDLPHATHLDLDILVYLQPDIFAEDDNVLNTWTSVNVYTYFKMRPGVSVAQLQERLTYWVNNESQFRDMTSNMDSPSTVSKPVTDTMLHKIMAVPELHLQARKDAGNMGDLSPMGDQKMINTFVIVAVLILLIACINFMNLATARASQRAREVAMRKVLGASRGQVALQFLGEAVAIVMISLLFALVAVELVLPLYNQALGRELTFELFNDLPMLFSLLGGALLVGLGAGLYPALYLSRFLPGHILKSNKSGESGATAKLRTVLVIIQFATSIGLVISTAVVFSQTNFVKSIDVGYVSDNKLILNVGVARNNLESLKQQLVNLPEISSVVYSSEAPTQDNENSTFFKLLENIDGQTTNEGQIFNYHNVGYGFFEAYEVNPIAGRLFSQSHGADMLAAPEQSNAQVNHASVVINQSVLKKLGLSDPQQAIGLTLFSQNVLQDYPFELKIVGVIPDIYFRSVKFDVRPSIYLFNPERFRVASLSFNSNNIPALLEKIETIWKNNVPMQPINISFLSEMMAAQYESEVTEAKLFSAFSLLAILVACLGLYGLAAFTAERRTKEIGIRKIMGARIQDIVTLLIWQFSKPVLVANLIAWPISIYAMTYWLQSFPYRIDLLWLLPICLVTGVLTLLIAWLTVGGNAAKVARANPIHALRSE
jgi:putative ABC transport system permease protein